MNPPFTIGRAAEPQSDRLLLPPPARQSVPQGQKLWMWQTVICPMSRVKNPFRPCCRGIGGDCAVLNCFTRHGPCARRGLGGLRLIKERVYGHSQYLARTFIITGRKRIGLAIARQFADKAANADVARHRRESAD